MKLRMLYSRMQRMLDKIEFIKDIGIMISKMEEDKNIMIKNKSIFMDIGKMESLFKD